MPVASVVETLSDDDAEADAPKEPGTSSSKKRRLSRPSREEKTTEEHLRSVLGRECWCSKKRCLQQFIEPAKFSSLLEYIRHWHQLHKMDQDQFVFRLNYTFGTWIGL